MEIKVNKILSPSSGFRKGFIKDSFSEPHQKSLGILSGYGILQETRDILISFLPNSSSIAVVIQLQVSPNNCYKMGRKVLSPLHEPLFSVISGNKGGRYRSIHPQARSSNLMWVLLLLHQQNQANTTTDCYSTRAWGYPWAAVLLLIYQSSHILRDFWCDLCTADQSSC